MKQPLNSQLDLFADRVSSLPVDEEPGLVEVTHPPAPGYNPELEVAGTHFFCLGCLSHINYKAQSKDPRYCQGCFDFLTEEANNMERRGTIHRPTWVPRSDGDIPVKRHRKHCNGTPPKNKIKRMALKGMSSKRIAAELIKDGYEVNYRSIPKILLS